MLTKNIREVFKTYQKNYKIFTYWQEEITKKVSEEEWYRIIHERANALHKAHKENQEHFDFCLNPILRHWTKLTNEEYDCLYHCLNDMYTKHYGDPFLIKKVALFLLEHYESIDSLDKKLYLYLFLGYANLEISRILPVPYGKESLEYYKKVISYAKQIDTLQETTRDTIFIAFNNLLRVETSLENIEPKEAYQVYEELCEMRSQETFCHYDKSNPRIPILADTAIKDFAGKGIQLVHRYKNMDKTTAEKLICMTMKRYHGFHLSVEQLREESSNFVCGYYTDMAEQGYISWNDAFLKMATYYNGVKNDCLTDSAMDPIGHVLDPIEFMMSCIPKTTFPKATKKKFAKHCRNEILRFIKYHTKVEFSYSLNSSLKSIILHSHALEMIDSLQEKSSFLFELMISRQLTTCLHSVMVTVLAEIVTTEIIKQHPDLLVGVCHTKNIEEVLKQGDEIKNFVHISALFHDIGKNSMTDIVNTEYRDLDDDEFEILREHPLIGKEYLLADKEFAKFCNVTQGHHKYYDGSEGYPMSFDTQHLKDKFVIDLIAICDSIDAATDSFGRNYQGEKSFDEVLKELIKDSGTRYHPAIVNIIKQDKISDKIRTIVEDKRGYIYYQVHKKIFQ